MGKKVIFTEKQIKMIAEAEEAKLRDNDIELDKESDVEDALIKQLGDDDSDRKINYPSKDDEMETEMEDEVSYEDDMDLEPETNKDFEMKDLKGSHELLEYLDKMEEAKSILSKVAAKEDNEKLKARVYSHYEKAQKLVFELIKEFGIVH